jgi:predicted transcriptional regulator
VCVCVGATMKERKKRRTREEIIYQILEACCEGINITEVAGKITLNIKIVNSYLELLIKNGMIQKKGGLYMTTRKGARILPVMKKVQDSLKFLRLS